MNRPAFSAHHWFLQRSAGARTGEPACIAAHACLGDSSDAAGLAPLFGTRRSVPRTDVVERRARLAAAIHGEMFEEDVLEPL